MATPTPPIKRLGEVLEQIGKVLEPSGVIYRIGTTARNDPAKRIVMEPSTRTWEPNHGVPRALFTRVESVIAHIWGDSMDEVEELEELLANAIIRVCTWTIRPGAGTWVANGDNQRGVKVRQEISFLIPIMRRELKAAFPAIELTTEIEQPA